MRYLVFACLLLAQGVGEARAEMTPVAPGQYGIGGFGPIVLSIPDGAAFATVCAEGAPARFTTDGVTVPSGRIGMPLPAGECVALSGPAVLSAFRAVAAGSLDVEYFR
ncbi:hypothetical protein DFR50_14241 [Roseiarcus fermentans]|uniref:Uncharacterized protein n=1 Tax=Roseiarcus fermentans TaxID=1473586 RepID=A0A366EN14_9HYPH|nr:hypothetical protein [Roseiarcus fermentans]RBP03793.1 hypothetical protein DFR50_14241 [Roseiarcus fermentans]